MFFIKTMAHMKQLFVNTGIPGLSVVQSSILPDVDAVYVESEAVSFAGLYNAAIDRIGLMYHNMYPYIPFGTARYTTEIDGASYTFAFFRQELVDYIALYDSNSIALNLDILTCDMNDSIFIDEVSKLQTLYPNVSINYSLNQTGGVIGADWIMESNSTSVRDIYFNSGIADYTYTLGIGTNSAVIDSSNILYYSGTNFYGEMGTSTNNGTSTAIPLLTVTIPSITNAMYVSAGLFHSAVIIPTSSGTLYTFGNNTSGMLGRTTTLVAPNFDQTAVSIASIQGKISSVRCGEFFTAVLTAAGTTNGTVYTFGDNTNGQLGRVTSPANSASQTPTAVSFAGAGITTHISCGQKHMALVNGGSVWTCGLNSNGQLGYATNNGTSTPNPTLTKIPDVGSFVNSSVVMVECGSSHTIVLKSNGDVFSFGYNAYGQLGRATAFVTDFVPTKITDALVTVLGCSIVACGALHTLLLRSNAAGSSAHVSSTVAAFGNNASGQLGRNSTVSGSNSVINIALVFDKPGTGILTSVVDVRGNNNGSYFVTTTAEALACGSNASGNLADNTTTNRLLPVTMLKTGATAVSSQVLLDSSRPVVSYTQTGGNGSITPNGLGRF